ncbi:MAG: 30S ribosomal protein S13 [Candidatus Aenigmarchaeota archaeon]|nr:30S ribosomal protein S13 [Candidatus Aenigmarchaeota archaeon]
MGSNKRVKEEEKPKGKGKEKEEPKKEEKKKPEIRRDIPRLIIRVAGTDLDGEKPVVRALRKIKGIGVVTSFAICRVANINPNVKLGSLNEEGISNLEGAVKNPAKFNLPAFILNRRKDPATGADMHLTSSDLDTAKKFDIMRYIDLKTYRGWRHMLGQPVRGQRTRSSFRHGDGTVGVIKKAVLQKPGAAPAAAGAASPTIAKPEADKTTAAPAAAKPAKK